MNYFRYKQFNKDVITVAVGYYLRYALSYRDISEILRERGVNVHHSTVYLSLIHISEPTRLALISY
ncbi:IS6 family transposase, partial [Staphylococcus aureus]|nr:IS6 family transposase [Staphylococcus aureus]